MNLSDALTDTAVLRTAALAALGDGWREMLNGESFNHAVYAQALITVLRQYLPSGTVAIRGISPVTGLFANNWPTCRIELRLIRSITQQIGVNFVVCRCNVAALQMPYLTRLSLIRLTRRKPACWVLTIPMWSLLMPCY